MNIESTEALHLNKNKAEMLLRLLTQASSPGPSARVLADLYDDVKGIARTLGVNTGE